MTKLEIFKELDKLGDDWYKYKNCSRDDAAGFGKKNEILGKIYELMPQLLSSYKYKECYEEVVHNFFIKEIAFFDPEKSKLSNFLSARIGNRIKSQEDLMKKKNKRIAIFLDEELEQDGKSSSKYDLIEDTRDEISAIDEKNYNQFQIMKTIAMFTRLSDQLKGRANNESKRKHFKNFYTDDVSELIVDTEALYLYVENEAEIMSALNISFLDFFTVEKCRSVKEINKSHVKKYSDMVDGKEKELSEDKRPFPGDVYISYFDKIENVKITNGAISQQRDSYYEFIRNNLMEK